MSIGAAASANTPDEVFLALMMIKSPSNYFESITERVINRGLILHRVVSLDIKSSPDALPLPANHSIVVPILMPARDQLVDNLVVTSIDGVTLQTRDHEEQLLFASQLIATQFAISGVASPPAHDYEGQSVFQAFLNVPRMPWDQWRNLRHLLTSAPAVGPTSRARPSSPYALDLLHYVRRSPSLMYLLDLVAARRIEICTATTDQDGRARLNYEYDAPFIERSIYETRVLLRDRLRKRFGLRMPNMRIFLGQRPLLARSYHFYMDAPRGYYVSRSRFVIYPGIVTQLNSGLIHVDKLDELPASNGPIERVIFEPPARLPYAHMYTEGCQRFRTTCYASLTYHERPPGSIGLALGVSLLALFPLLVTFPFMTTLLDNGSNGMAPLIVGFPGLAAAALSARRDRTSLAAMTLVGYFGLLGTSLLSAAAALILAIGPATNQLILLHDAPFTLTMKTAMSSAFLLVVSLQVLLTYTLHVRGRMSLAIFEQRDAEQSLAKVESIMLHSIRSIRSLFKKVRRQQRKW